MTTIACRGRLPGCLHGQAAAAQFGEDAPLSEDSTYDGETLICDACYVAIMPLTPSGQGLHHELPDALERARASAG